MSKAARPAKRQPGTVDWTGISVARAEYRAPDVIFAQGDSADSVCYLSAGTVRLSVLSRAGKEAVVAILTAGNFFGEGCLAGQMQRAATATAMSRVTILTIDREEMVRQLRARPPFAKAFLRYMLTRKIRIEEDLLDQLFNSTEKRVARILLLLAEPGQPESGSRSLPRVSQQIVAEMVGTTRSRVNFFMNKFRKLGFIEYGYNGACTVNDALLSVIGHD